MTPTANSKNPYDAMTQDEFYDILHEVAYESKDLLSVPGAYEVFAEHYNNEVLKRWADKKGIELPEDE